MTTKYAKFVKEARIKKGLSQAEVATKLGEAIDAEFPKLVIYL